MSDFVPTLVRSGLSLCTGINAMDSPSVRTPLELVHPEKETADLTSDLNLEEIIGILMA